MMPENDGPASEGADAARDKIQKKSWRTKVVYEEWTRMRKILQLAWTTHPLERLQSSLAYLDSTPRSALDLVFCDRQNPFCACRMKFAQLMNLGIGGPFVLVRDLARSSPRGHGGRDIMSIVGLYCSSALAVH